MIAPNAPADYRADLLWKLLYYLQERGKDATGVGWHDANGNPRVVKGPVNASEFIKGELFDQVAEEMPTSLIAHCRAKTKGDPKQNVNNHPVFSKISGLMLVHNGKLDDDKWRRQKDGVNPYMYGSFDGEVDTEAGIRLIETMRYIPRNAAGRVDPELVAATPKDDWRPLVDWHKAVDDAVYNLAGTYAFAIMTPEDPNSVILVRHDNPIYIAYLEELDAMVWASTDTILKKAIAREINETVFKYFTRTMRIEPEFIGRDVDNNHMIQIRYKGPRDWEITGKKIDPPTSGQTRQHITVTRNEVVEAD